jgi:hypothetical protein
MDRRLILGLVIAALVGALGIAACGPAPSGAPGASAAAATGPAATPSGPGATCTTTSQLIAVRATAADTGFPLPVEWLGLGPVDDLFFTQSEVAPRIPIDPAGPASIILALAYMDGSGDRYKLTGGSLTLAYDPATGRLSGSLDTGYGKNSNRATTDTVPSGLDAIYTRPVAAGGTGLLEGTITHPDREDYHFRVQMTEQTEAIVTGPGCATPRPTDTL